MGLCHMLSSLCGDPESFVRWGQTLTCFFFIDEGREDKENHLTLKVPRKKMHLKISSAEVVCCKLLPNITEELSIEANSMNPEQTAPI